MHNMDADRDDLWDDYQAAENKLHDALDEAFLTPELRDRIDSAYADCIGAARRTCSEISS